MRIRSNLERGIFANFSTSSSAGTESPSSSTWCKTWSKSLSVQRTVLTEELVADGFYTFPKHVIARVNQNVWLLWNRCRDLPGNPFSHTLFLAALIKPRKAIHFISVLQVSLQPVSESGYSCPSVFLVRKLSRPEVSAGHDEEHCQR